MDKGLKLIKDKMEKHRLNADSVFVFHCTKCGDCCRHREDILLNPFDLYRLAKGFKKSPQSVAEQYCEMYIGQSSGMPVVRLKTVGDDKSCIFLKDNICSVQDFKPTVCAMFPLGRFYQSEKDSTIGYIFNDATCGDKSKKHTVREWLGKYDIPIEDEFYKLWVEAIGKITAKLAEFEEQSDEKTMNSFGMILYVCLYLCYDTEKEFMEQFKENVEKITNYLEDSDDE